MRPGATALPDAPVTSNSGLTLTPARPRDRDADDESSLDEEAFIVAGYAVAGPPLPLDAANVAMSSVAVRIWRSKICRTSFAVSAGVRCCSG